MTLAMLAGIALFTGGCFLSIRRRKYVLTTDRARVAVGLRSTAVTAIDLEDVDEVALTRRRWHRWLNAGDLRFVANGDEVLTFESVEDPFFVYDRVLNFV